MSRGNRRGWQSSTIRSMVVLPGIHLFTYVPPASRRSCFFRSAVGSTSLAPIWTPQSNAASATAASACAASRRRQRSHRPDAGPRKHGPERIRHRHAHTKLSLIIANGPRCRERSGGGIAKADGHRNDQLEEARRELALASGLHGLLPALQTASRVQRGRTRLSARGNPSVDSATSWTQECSTPRTRAGLRCRRQPVRSTAWCACTRRPQAAGRAARDPVRA